MGRAVADLTEPADTVLDLHTAGAETAPHVYAHVPGRAGSVLGIATCFGLGTAFH